MKRKMVTAEAMKRKIKSIENTVEKSKVRQDFIGLVNQHLFHMDRQNKGITDFNCLTLPAADWFFEKGLINGTKNAFYLKTKPTIKFDGVDWGFQTSLEALENMPENSTLTGSCSFDDFLKYETIVKKNGYSRINTDIPRKEALQYYLVWADFCNDATVSTLKNFVNIIKNNVKTGFVGITVKLSARKKGSCEKEYIGRFKKYCSSRDRESAVEVTINKMLHMAGCAKKARCVYSVKYAGGEAGRSRMLTLVYAVNIPDNVITTIREDRTEKLPCTQTRKLFAAKLRNVGRWDIKLAKMGRKCGKTKKPLTKEEKRVILAVDRWEKVWGKLCKDKKAKVAAKYGKSLHSFGSMVACRHGKHRDRRNLSTVV